MLVTVPQQLESCEFNRMSGKLASLNQRGIVLAAGHRFSEVVHGPRQRPCGIVPSDQPKNELSTGVGISNSTR